MAGGGLDGDEYLFPLKHREWGQISSTRSKTRKDKEEQAENGEQAT